jgi:hypothetical protein
MPLLALRFLAKRCENHSKCPLAHPGLRDSAEQMNCKPAWVFEHHKV